MTWFGIDESNLNAQYIWLHIPARQKFSTVPLHSAGRACIMNVRVIGTNGRSSAKRANSMTEPSVNAVKVYWWHSQVLRDEKSGRIIENIPNTKKILGTDPRWEGVFRWNEMHRRVFVHRDIPGLMKGDEIRPRPMQDFDVARCRAWMQDHGGMWMVAGETVYSAIREIATFNTYHPIKEDLRKVEWDGVKRLDTMLVKFFGAPDIPYTRMVSRMFMIGMVRRVCEPGCKMDYMLVLEGAQGLGKSTAAKILAGEEYFGEAHFKELDSADTSIFLKNKWVVEFGEMHTLRKGEVNELKLWLSKQVEDYRPPYGRENVHEPRQCVFIGTSNNTEYLRDATGARRFWPVFCRAIDLEGLLAARSQLLAEALVAVEAGESNFPPKDAERDFFVEEQAKRNVTDPWQDFLEPMTRAHKQISLDLICQKLRLERSKLDLMSQGRIKDIMTGLGWEYHRTNSSRYWREIPKTKIELEKVLKAGEPPVEQKDIDNSPPW